jgi:Mg/Co/Ni transporter MgtE
LERIPPADLTELLQVSEPTSLVPTLTSLAPELVATLLSALPTSQATALLAQLPLEYSVLVLRQMAPAERTALLEGFDPETARPLTSRLTYAPGTVGALMDPFALTLPVDISIAEALERLRSSLSKREGPYVYLVDREHHLVGTLSFHALIAADPDAALVSVMHSQLIKVAPSTSEASLLRGSYWRELRAVPVVDAHGVLLGLVRYATVRRLQEDVMRRAPADSALRTWLNLGELYWQGLATVLGGVTERGDTQSQRQD